MIAQQHRDHPSRPAQAKMNAEREHIGGKTVHWLIGQTEVDSGARAGITSDRQAEINSLEPISADWIKSGEAWGRSRSDSKMSESALCLPELLRTSL